MTTKHTKPRTRIRRVLRLAGRSLVAVTVLLVALYLLRGPLFARPLARYLATVLSERTGGEFTLERVDGGWISDATLVGLRTVRAPAGSPLRDLSFAETRVTYRLWGAWSDPAGALRTVDARGLVVALDGRSAPEAEPGGETPALGEVLDAVPPALRSVAADGSLTLLLDDGEASVGRFDLDAHDGAAVLVLDDVAVPVFGRIERSERLRAVLSREDARSFAVSFDGRLAGVAPRGATLAQLPDATLDVSLRADVAGGTVVVRAGAGTVHATTQIDLASLPEWVARALPDLDLPPPGALEGALEGDAQARWDAEGIVPTLVGARVEGLTWRSTRLDTLQVDLTRDADGSYRGSASASTAGATLTANPLVLDAGAAHGVRAATVALETPDAAAALRALGMDAAAGELRGLPTAAAFSGRLRDGRVVEIDALEVRAPRSRGDVSGRVVLPERSGAWGESEPTLELSVTAVLDELVPLAPEAWELPVCSGALHATGALSGTLAAPTGSFAVEADGVRLDRHDVRALGLAGTFDGSLVHAARVSVETSFLTLAGSGDVDLAGRRLTAGNVEVDAASLAELSSAFDALPDLAGALRVTARLDGPLPEGAADRGAAGHWADRFVGLVGELSARGDGLRVDRFEIGALQAQATAEWPRVRIGRLRADGGLGSVELHGELDARVETFGVEGRVTVADLSVLAPVFGSLPPLAGSLTVEGAATKSAQVAWREVAGRARVRGEALRVGEHDLGRIEASVTADGADVAVDAVRVSGAWGSAEAAATLRLVADGGAVHVRRLQIDADAYPPLRDLGVRLGRVELSRAAEVVWDAESVTASDVALSVLGGKVAGRVRLGPQFEARLVATALDLGRLPGGVGGRADLRLSVTGPVGGAAGRVELSVPDLEWEGERGELHLTATQAAGGLDVETLVLDLGDTARVTAGGTLPLRLTRDGVVELPGLPEFELRAVSERPAGWLRRLTPDIGGVERVELVARGAGGTVTADLSARNVGWHPDDPAGPGLPGDTHVQLTADGAGVVATVRGGSAGPLGATGELRVGAALDWRRPGAFLESLPGASLAGRLDLDAPDLTALARWVEQLVRVSGSARGNVTFGGTVGAPTWEGALDARDLSLRVEGDLPTVGGGALRLTFDEREVRLERLDALLGYAPVRGSGTLSLAETGYVLDLRVEGENVLLARSPDLRLRADIDLTVSGPLEGLLVKGRVAVTDALYSRAMDLVGGRASADDALQLFSFREPPLSGLRFDVRVLADETVRVENNVLDGAFAVDLRLRGTGAVPEPEGRIEFRDVRVTLPLTALQVERGSIEFPPGSPFDPRVRAGAFTRMKGYDLNVQLTGTLGATSVQVAASPPLPQEDALLLLTTGATPQELERDGIGSVALGKAGALLGQSVLSWVSGPRDPDATPLTDRITVEFGREQSESGATTIEAELQLADRWYLRLERDRYDDYNAGVVWRLRFR